MKIQWKQLLIALAIPLAVGGLSALISGGMSDYQDLAKPPLSPPGWVFAVVWPILYLLMGYASYLIYTADAPEGQKKRALTLYAIQLVLNVLWSPVYFGLEWRLVAFFILIALWVAILLTMRAFSMVSEKAGDLLLPYVLWVTFAAYLNLGTVLLN